MAHYVNIGELENLGIDIQTYAEKEIRGEIDKLLSLGEKYVWIGKASKSYFAKYKEIMSALYEYSDMVEKFGFFLRYVSEGYTDVGKESKQMFQKYVDEVSGGKKSYLWESDV